MTIPRPTLVLCFLVSSFIQMIRCSVSPTFESYLQQNGVLSFSCSSAYGSVQLYIWLVAARQLLGCRCAFGSLTDYCMSAKSQLFVCSLGCSMTFVWVQLDNYFGCSLAFGCVQRDNCLGAAWGAASQLIWCILTTGLVQVDIGCSRSFHRTRHANSYALHCPRRFNDL